MAQLGESTLSQDVLLGTPHYISPEQAMGNRDLDARTDLYSLGIVLYELIVGRVPFSADTPYAVIHDQIYRPLPKPSEINPEITPQIDAVLEKALAKHPADRYATATEMIDAFRRALDNSGLQSSTRIAAASLPSRWRSCATSRTSPPTRSRRSASRSSRATGRRAATAAPTQPLRPFDDEADNPPTRGRGFPVPPSSIPSA